MSINTRKLIAIQILLLSMMVLNSNIHLPCFLKFREDFGVDERTVQLAFILNPFVAAATSIVYGLLIDKVGQKRLLLTTIAIFIAGTITCIYALSIKGFMLGRFFQGLGDAGIAVATAVVMGSFYKGAQYARVQAISNGVLSFSWAFAPVIGANVYAYSGWRWNFIIMLVLMTLVTIPLFWWKEDTNKSMAPKEAEILSESKTILKIFFEKKFLIPAFAHAIPLGIFTAIETSSPFIFMAYFNYDPQQYANINLFIISANILGSMFYLVLVKRFSLEQTIKIGLTPYLLFLIMTLVFLLFKSTNSVIFFVFLFTLEAFALPFFISTCTTKIVESYPTQLGKTLSLVALVRNIASFLIALICSYALKYSITLLIAFILGFTMISLFFMYKMFNEMQKQVSLEVQI